MLMVGRSEARGRARLASRQAIPFGQVVYVGHPGVPKLYYPTGEFHRRVFEHKFCEAVDLLGALGASKITVERQEGFGREEAAELDVPLTPKERLGGKLSRIARPQSEVLFESTAPRSHGPSPRPRRTSAMTHGSRAKVEESAGSRWQRGSTTPPPATTAGRPDVARPPVWQSMRLRTPSGRGIATSPRHRRKLGAFYTPPAIAKLLVDWAIQTSDDRALDPASGVWFSSKQRRAARGSRAVVPRPSDGTCSGSTSTTMRMALWPAAVSRSTRQPGPSRLLRDGAERGVPLCQAVVGNPPYIRYQGWDGTRARQLAETAGVRLTRLASSWAPFVVHATAFVAPRGRLAMVLPAEMLHAQYASEVVSFLARSYGRLQLAVFEERVFPGALEEVVLLFADGRGKGRAEGIELVECRTLDDLTPRCWRGPPSSAPGPTAAPSCLPSCCPTPAGSSTKLVLA